MPGHGPASALPNHPDPNDNRRVIRVVINNLGNPNDPTSWYDPTINGPNSAVETAIREAASRWNNATDQFGNRTGYFYHVTASQTAQDLLGADIIVRKDNPQFPGACLDIEDFGPGMTQIQMRIPQEAATRPADRLAGDATHEMGHPQGLYDSACSGVTLMGFALGGCSSPVFPQEATHPTSADVTVSNQFLNQGPSSCSASSVSGDPPSCSDPCSDSSCPGYSLEACSNYSDQTTEYIENRIPDYVCIDTYTVTTYYWCTSGGCTYAGSFWEYEGTECFLIMY